MAALPRRGRRGGRTVLRRQGALLGSAVGAIALAAAFVAGAFPPAPASAEPTATPAARLRAVEARLVQVAKASTPKTVCLRIDKDGKPYGFGSGAIVSAEGEILTCAHVTEPARGASLVAIFPDGRESKVEVVASNSRNDYSLARLSPPGKDLPHFDLAAKDPALGDWVVALGHPGGPFPDHTPSVSVGKVTGVGRRMPVFLEGKSYVDAIQTDAPLFGGNSGGPLVDLDGKLVGIDGLIVLAGDAAFATPASRLRASLPTLRQGKEVIGERAGSAFESMRQLAGDLDFEELAEAIEEPELRELLKTIYSRDPTADDDDDDPASAPARATRRGEEIRAAFPLPPPGRGPRMGLDLLGRLLRAGAPIGWATRVSPVTGIGRETPQYATSGWLVGDGKDLSVDPGNGEGPRPATLVGVAGDLGIALLRVDARPWSRAGSGGDVGERAPKPGLAPGRFVLVGGDGGIAQVAAVSAVDRDVGTERRTPTLGITRLLRAPNTTPFRPFSKVIQIDGPLEAAQMGAPVWDGDGALLGVAVAHLHPGATIVVPLQAIRARMTAGWKDVPAPLTYGRDPRPPREKPPAPPPRTPRVSFYVPRLSGMLRRVRFGDPVGSPEAGTPPGPVCTTGSVSPPFAPRAGDVLVSIGGTATPTVAAAKTALAPLAEGAVVPIVLARKGTAWTTETLHAKVASEDGQRRLVLEK